MDDFDKFLCAVAFGVCVVICLSAGIRDLSNGSFFGVFGILGAFGFALYGVRAVRGFRDD